ncbi:hypothetical protein BH11PSE12_BH11PSE12_05860 [soil metagenome]
MRLVLDPNTGASKANSIILTTSPANTNEIAFETPSAVQSGIKLNHEFDVISGQRVDLVLDFDACKSVVKRGNSGAYGLKPVVNVIPTVLNGIDGFINKASLGSHVQVSAQQNGKVIRSTVPNANGEFFLGRLIPGNYDVVITADDHAATVVGAVPVVSTTSVVKLSSDIAPIDLPTISLTGSISGMATLNPASATEIAYVAAQQSFAAGPTVTVKYQGVDVSGAVSGAYTLSQLPVAAARYAPYSATLPILFTIPATAPGTGMYRVQASANGYTSQFLPSVNISTANQVGVNFTLIP